MAQSLPINNLTITITSEGTISFEAFTYNVTISGTVISSIAGTLKIWISKNDSSNGIIGDDPIVNITCYTSTTGSEFNGSETIETESELTSFWLYAEFTDEKGTTTHNAKAYTVENDGSNIGSQEPIEGDT